MRLFIILYLILYTILLVLKRLCNNLPLKQLQQNALVHKQKLKTYLELKDCAKLSIRIINMNYKY